ncbi:MAG: NAD-dependent epimerase/dehydratase family protein [Chloroflexi bacterium]|nr:NAD-dependent epimerase/dehydratase family protein [Chloroflexota bacterium]
MKVLYIGGTGLISSACSQLAIERGMALYILNRAQSRKHDVPAGAQILTADVRADRAAVADQLKDHYFDAVVDWIAFTPADIERDIELFAAKTRQFVFISSASVYQKPPNHYLITEDTPLANPHWAYSQNKIACEERLMDEYRRNGFPITIIRPSLTYGPSQIPIVVGSWQHPWTIVDRMKRGQKVIVPGDGTSLWPLTYNTDFAKGLVGLLGREQTIGHAFHITSDEVLSWNQIYVELGHAIGVEPKLVHIPSDLIAAYDPDSYGSLIGDKIYSVVFDNSKIKRFVPDYVATVPWTEGVREALAWFEADPSRRTIDDDANRKWDSIIAAYERAWPQSS